MNRQVIRFVQLIALLAIACSMLVRQDTVDLAPQALTLVTALVTIGLLSELLAYELARGASASSAIIPYLAACILAPTWEVIVAIGLASTAAALLQKKEIIKCVFNISQLCLSVGVGILAYRLLGGIPLTATPAESIATAWVIPAIGLAVAFQLVNSLAVSGVISRAEDASFWEIWKENTLGTIAYTALSVPLIFALAWVTARFGVSGAILFSVPILGIRQLYKTTLQLQKVNQELLELMVKAIEARDPYTSGHSRRVSRSATIIAQAIGLSTRQVERVRIAALLHDVGKIHEVFASILRKPGKLTAEEWAIMQTHPERGAELVATLSHLDDVVGAIRHHHENWDGKGYPDRISGETIPLASRIITLADTLDALTTDRPYRAALTEDAVRAEFTRCCGTQFDPKLIGQVLAPTVWSQLCAPEPVSDPKVLRISGPRRKLAASS